LRARLHVNRRTVKVLGVTLAAGSVVGLVTVTEATGVLSRRPPPKVADAGHRASLPVVPSTRPTDVQENNQQKAQDSALEVRNRRRLAGAEPVVGQVARFSSESSLPRDAVLDRGTAIVTFVKPVPADLFLRDVVSLQGGAAPTAITIYMELPDGYPFTVSGKPDQDLPHQLRAFMADMSESLRRGQQVGPTTQRERQQLLADRIDAAIPNVSNVAVVLGVTFPLRSFLQNEPTIRDSYRVAAVEVDVSGNTRPFKNIEQRLDATILAQLRGEYSR